MLRGCQALRRPPRRLGGVWSGVLLEHRRSLSTSARKRRKWAMGGSGVHHHQLGWPGSFGMAVGFRCRKQLSNQRQGDMSARPSSMTLGNKLALQTYRQMAGKRPEIATQASNLGRLAGGESLASVRCWARSGRGAALAVFLWAGGARITLAVTPTEPAVPLQLPSQSAESDTWIPARIQAFSAHFRLDARTTLKA